MIFNMLKAVPGLVFESGVYTPAMDETHPTIEFANTHAGRPFAVHLYDGTGSKLEEYNPIVYWSIFSWYDYAGDTFIPYHNDDPIYARVSVARQVNNTISNTGYNVTSLDGTTATTSMGFHLSSAGFSPYCGEYYYLLSGRTYKWIAAWKPET